VVNRGFSVQTESPLAVKTVFDKLVAQAEVNGLQFEIPHAVRYRGEIERTHDEYCVVMDEVAGKTLADGPARALSEIEAIACQQFEILEDLEDKGLINWDIKPENLIWNPASRSLSIIDLESLRLLGEPSETEPSVTLENVAPEALLGKEIDSSYNIWATGCLFFELIVGEKLFSTLHQEPENGEYILQQIVEQLGTPTKEYLDACEDSGLFFDDKQEMKPKWPAMTTGTWSARLTAALEKKGATALQIAEWNTLLASMLRYEGRASVQELLKSPLCSKEIRLRLMHDRMNKCQMVLTRASEAGADITIDFRKEKNCCLHIPKDPNDQYKLVVKKGSQQVEATLTLTAGQTVDIYSYQSQVAPEKKRLFE